MIILRQKEFARKKGKKNIDYLKEFIEDDIKEHENAGMPVDSSFLDKLREPIDNKTKRGDLRNMQDLAIHNARSRDRGDIEFTPERGVRQERFDKDYVKKNTYNYDARYNKLKSSNDYNGLRLLNEDRKWKLKKKLNPKSLIKKGIKA